MAAASHMWFFTFKLINIKNSSPRLATFPVHLWLVATILDGADTDPIIMESSFRQRWSRKELEMGSRSPGFQFQPFPIICGTLANHILLGLSLFTQEMGE